MYKLKSSNVLCQIRIDIQTLNLVAKEREVFLLLCEKEV